MPLTIEEVRKVIATGLMPIGFYVRAADVIEANMMLRALEHVLKEVEAVPVVLVGNTPNRKLVQFIEKLSDVRPETGVKAAVVYYVDSQQKATIVKGLIEHILMNEDASRAYAPIVILDTPSRLPASLRQGGLLEVSRESILDTIIESHYRGTSLYFEDKIKSSLESVKRFIRLVGFGAFHRLTNEYASLGKAVDDEVLARYKLVVLREMGYDIVQPRYGFEKVGGLRPVKDFIRTFIAGPLQHGEEYKLYGVTPARGVLFYGPPGTGKTWLASALAKEVGLPIVKVSASKIFSKYVGESEANVEKFIRTIENIGDAIVFIDEAEQLFLGRDRTVVTDSGVSQRVLSMLLDWMGSSERKGIIVMNTNFVDNLDFAAIRAGRVDFVVPVPLPDYETRREILRIHLNSKTSDVNVNVDYDAIARATAGFSAAELELTTRVARLYAARGGKKEITNAHVTEALRMVKVNVERRIEMLNQVVTTLRSLPTAVVPSELVDYVERVANEIMRDSRQSTLQSTSTAEQQHDSKMQKPRRSLLDILGQSQ